MESSAVFPAIRRGRGIYSRAKELVARLDREQAAKKVGADVRRLLNHGRFPIREVSLVTSAPTGKGVFNGLLSWSGGQFQQRPDFHRFGFAFGGQFED